jgi:hypothetical protein
MIIVINMECMLISCLVSDDNDQIFIYLPAISYIVAFSELYVHI